MEKIALIILFILVSSTFSFGQVPVESPTKLAAEKEWKLLTDDKFEITYPIDWKLDTSKQLGATFFLFSPLTDKDDQFSENVNFIIQDLTGHNLTLDQYVELSENQINTLITDAEIILSKRQNVNDNEYQKIIYSGKQGVFILKFEQYYWVIENKAYVLTLTCELKEFEAYKEVGEKILNSFILK